MSRGVSVFLISCLAIQTLTLEACSHRHASDGTQTPPTSSSPPPVTTPPPTTPPPVTPPPVTPPPVTAPTAAFTAPATAAANAPVAFDASASSSTDGSTLQYFWDFGNGHHGGGAQIARVFASAGAQSVTLTVVDGSGRTGSVTKAVTISAPPVATATASVQGAITGLDGAAIAGVTVAQVGGAATGTTDTAGHVTLTLGLGVPLTLKLSASGFSDQFVSVQLPTTAASDAYFEATMRPRDAAQTLADATAGGTLSGRDGAVLTLPPNALVDGTGAAVTGAVQISITPVDVTQPKAAGFPGSFDGVTMNGTATPIVSYGTVEYVLSVGGAPLQLASGKTATIEIPVYAQLNADGTPVAAGGTTPLWSLDEITGIWVQEGTGTIVASSSSPTGLAMRATVTHFSWWNADDGFDPTGPKPRCADATNIGIPGGTDHLANATICNMLAQFAGNSGGAGVSAPGRLKIQSATLSPRIVGYARRVMLPIAGGVIVPVPANVNIALSSTALNGTWAGRTIYNGAVGVQADVVIPLSPIAGTGTGPEAVTLPLDTTRSLQTAQTALFSFTATNLAFLQVTIAQANGSTLVGQVRLLKGTTEIGKALFSGLSGTFTAPVSADGVYTLEVTATSGTPGAYQLQAMAIGSIQTSALQLPFDVSGTLPTFTNYRGTFTMTAPGAAVFGYQRAGSGADAAFTLIAPNGTAALTFDPKGATTQAGPVDLPVAGTYTVQLATPGGSSGHYRITGESTPWSAVAPPLTTDSIYSVVDLVADRNGKPVLGSAKTVTVSGVSSANSLMLRRWTGSAWETVGADLTIPLPCSGVSGFAFDANNAPVVAYASNTAGGGSIVTALRYTGGAWQSLGANGGVLPNQSSSDGACTAAPPVVSFGADGAPLIAYVVDGVIYVQRFDGTTWGAVTTTATDNFPIPGGSMDMRADASGQVWLVTAAPFQSTQSTTVRRLTTTTTPATWTTIGPNGGVLANPAGLNAPQLRFDGANQPVIMFRAGTLVGNSLGSGVAVYRYDGSQWSSSGGYNADSHSSLGSYTTISLAPFGGETYVSWTNSNNVTFTNTSIVQKYTGAGYTPVGTGLGEIPQYSPHGLVVETGQEPRLLAIGDTLYLALATTVPNGIPGQPVNIRLLQKVN
jgi:PKD domain